jgi:hypothetical protein
MCIVIGIEQAESGDGRMLVVIMVILQGSSAKRSNFTQGGEGEKRVPRGWTLFYVSLQYPRGSDERYRLL